MRPSQAEIKAIEAELRSIRADSSVSLLDSANLTPIAPTISLNISPNISPKLERPKPAETAAKRRSIECFPIAEITVSQTVGQTVSRLASARTSTQQRIDLGRAMQQKTRFARPAQPSSQAAISRQMLAEKAHQINQLSAQQEAVILELITLSEQIESANAICETAEVPHVDADAAGTLVLTSRTIELPPEERRARRRPRRSQLMLASTGAVWQGTWGLLSTLGAAGRWLLSPLGLLPKQPRRVTRTAGRRASGRRRVEEFTFQEAAILVLGSAMLRVGLDLLVASYPMLWMPSLLVMLTPAAIAIYRSTLAPQAGFIWGYRLFALMIGLLLGGRLL